MGTRTNGAELHADPRGIWDAAQRRQGQQAARGRAAGAGAQEAGRTKGGRPRAGGGGTGRSGGGGVLTPDARAPACALTPPREGGTCGDPARGPRLRRVGSDQAPAPAG